MDTPTENLELLHVCVSCIYEGGVQVGDVLRVSLPTTDVITIDALNFITKVFIAKLFNFYRHVESNRGSSMIFDTVSSP
jgi:hypothetical protein